MDVHYFSSPARAGVMRARLSRFSDMGLDMTDAPKGLLSLISSAGQSPHGTGLLGLLQPAHPNTPTPMPVNPGMLYRGNIDMTTRPQVQNPDGSISTIRSMSYGTDSGEVLIPTVSDEGKIMAPDEAIAYWQAKQQALGVFDTPQAADMYARRLHHTQEHYYGLDRKK